MKRILAIVLTGWAAAASADVEALYWQVTSEMNSTPVAFAVAAMVAENAGTSEKVYLTDSLGNAWQSAKSSTDYTTEIVASTFDSSVYSSGWSFYIELMNNSGGTWQQVGIINNGSSNYSYSDIQSHVSSTTSLANLQMASALSMGTVHPTPEPTSGLMMLLGSALLALRRRRA